jgi:hypothetical protein
MAALTNYTTQALYNALVKNTAYTSPTTVYIGAYTAAPTDAGGGTEVTGNAYARQALTMGTGTNGVGTNSAAATFPAATPAGWGAIVAFGVFDAVTAGNLLFWGTCSTTINTGDQLQFAIGAVSLTMDTT